MKFTTDLTYEQYMTLCAVMADNYFDDNGDFASFNGRIASMMLFYQYCVDHTDDPYWESIEDIESVESYVPIFADEEFAKAYACELKDGSKKNRLTFNQAYYDAQEIVNARLNTVNGIITSIRKIGIAIIDSVGNLLDEKNLKTLISLATKIAPEIKNLDVLQDALYKQYAEETKKEEGEPPKLEA